MKRYSIVYNAFEDKKIKLTVGRAIDGRAKYLIRQYDESGKTIVYTIFKSQFLEK